MKIGKSRKTFVGEKLGLRTKMNKSRKTFVEDELGLRMKMNKSGKTFVGADKNETIFAESNAKLIGTEQ